MGREIYHFFPVARAVYEEASDTLGFDVRRLCFQAPQAELTATQNAQPAIFVSSMAALRVLQEIGVKPQMVAGHSVGEISALVAAGVLPFAEAMRAVRRRGELMAPVKTPGAMVAVLGLGEEKMAELCLMARELGDNCIALYNTPQQLVVSGTRPAVEKVEELAQAAGAIQVVRLNVSHAFHSPLMTEVVTEWANYVQGLSFHEPQVPVFLNTTGQMAESVGEIRQALVEQLNSPVRWHQCVQSMLSKGMTMAVEVGASKGLTGFNRSIERNLQTIPLENPAAVKMIKTAVNSARAVAVSHQ